MTKMTNFDKYLEEQFKEPGFRERFQEASEAWDLALQISALRQKAGISQKELAKTLGTSQQQISRLESSGYQGHTVGSLRRLAKALNANLRITLEAMAPAGGAQVAEPVPQYAPQAKPGPRKGVSTKKSKGLG